MNACRHFVATTKEKGATFSRNPLFYLVELAGVEPASEIPAYPVLYPEELQIFGVVIAFVHKTRSKD
ncbi:TPA_asm: hypothetical protein G1T00_07575 [Salmonella enterica subsp. enterica serovar Typhi str. CT18]|uniref:Peptidase n=7 Tax=Salmonella enterica TaxID=28901 RepID=A0A3U8Y1Y0_SALET|nr:hypothetical protein [Salmonella enterica subsp. enterica serovar Typhi]EAB2823671.1 hypothetical protein [Salmonella enterica]EBB4502853.1 hypothetical protein [Salmonella enterica subsp. enterica serovar Typhimurium]EBH8523598.1 hypothetical protein [Salmonella enterica subsp. enterica serovar Typhi str. CR0044]HAB6919370.1 hypothetical protein [Salmonella enterica subsp. enterica serovar Typhi str. CT18]HAB6963836.1 hypothetical protein [Salmonella enterica subsp. enterica serovar Typhi 